MRKSKKVIFGLLALFLAVCVVGATLNVYFGQINTTVDVKQSVTIDGDTALIEHTMNLFSGESEEVKHRICNEGSINVNVTEITTGLTTGLSLSIAYSNGTEVDFPLKLEGSQKITLVFTYDTDINLKAGKYIVRTYMKCEEI